MSEVQMKDGNGAVIWAPRQTAAEIAKHDRFLRLAPGRVQRALDALRQVGRLSLPENEYSEHEASQIVSALQLQVDEVERSLVRRKSEKPTFAFD